MRVMLDTNILVSAFIFKSKNIYELIEKLSTKHKIIISEYCIDELYEVINKKFKNKKYAVDEFIESFPFEKVETPKNIDRTLFQIRDEDDYIILYSAIIKNVDIFITGDKDFENINVSKPKIMTIKEFLNTY